MSNTTLAIILAIALGGVSLWMSLENRKLIALQMDMMDNVGHTIETELNGRIEDE